MWVAEFKPQTKLLVKEFEMLSAKNPIQSSDYTIYLLLIDMSNVFDSVRRDTLFERLEKILPPDELHLLSIINNRPNIQNQNKWRIWWNIWDLSWNYARRLFVSSTLYFLSSWMLCRKQRKYSCSNHTKTLTTQKQKDVKFHYPTNSWSIIWNTHKKTKMTTSFGVISITTLSSKTTTQIGRNANYWEAY